MPTTIATGAAERRLKTEGADGRYQTTNATPGDALDVWLELAML